MKKFKVRLTDRETNQQQEIFVNAASARAAASSFDSKQYEISVEESVSDSESETKKFLGMEISNPRGNRQALISLGVIALLVGGFFLMAFVEVEASRSGHDPNSAVMGLFALAGIGSFCFFVVYYLAKIANKN